MEQALLVDKVLEVVVVECGRGLEVQRGEVVVAGDGGAGAVALPGLGEGAVDVGVVVDVGSEVCAPGLANGVSTYVEQNGSTMRYVS